MGLMGQWNTRRGLDLYGGAKETDTDDGLFYVMVARRCVS